MKRKLFFWSKKYINSNNIKITILLAPMIAVLIQQIKSGTFDWAEFFDVSILITFIFVGLCEGIAKIIQRKVAQVAEDSAKLDDVYAKLSKKYKCSDLVSHQDNLYPEECVWLRSGSEEIIVEDDPDKYYQLPTQVAENSKEIMEAHSASVVYNQINIRLDNVEVSEDQVVLHTSRTYFYDSLLTNRACDYVFGDRKATIREIYEPGPFMKPLHLSKMSNHLGFNGFVLTSDKKSIPFIFRNKKLSIAKNLWATSVGASLKSKFALDHSNRFQMTSHSLSDAIIGEIKDELRITDDSAFTPENVKNSIFAVYRDYVECGKPQFLFCLQLNDITEDALRASVTRRKKPNDTEVDGDKVRFFTIEQLKNAEFGIDSIKINGVEYKMMPSSVVSVVLLLKYYENREVRESLP